MSFCKFLKSKIQNWYDSQDFLKVIPEQGSSRLYDWSYVVQIKGGHCSVDIILDMQRYNCYLQNNSQTQCRTWPKYTGFIIIENTKFQFHLHFSFLKPDEVNDVTFGTRARAQARVCSCCICLH